MKLESEDMDCPGKMKKQGIMMRGSEHKFKVTERQTSTKFWV